MFGLAIINSTLTIGQASVIQIGKSVFNSMFISYVVTSTPDTDYVSFAGYGKAAGLYLRNDGNVGIGTSTPAAQFTAYLAAGGSRPVAIGSGDVYMTLGQDGASGTNGSVIQCYAGGNSSTIGTSAYRLLLQPYGSSVIIGGTADNGNRLQVNGVSNFTSSVGIGITNPTKPLVVVRPGSGGANPAIMVGNNGSGAGLRFQTYDLTAQTDAYMGLGTDMGGFAFEHSLVFTAPTTPGYVGNGRQTIGSYDGTTYSTKMTILGSGFVGIGTTSPSYPLHVGISTSTSGSVRYFAFNSTSGTTQTYSGSFAASIYAIYDVTTSGSMTCFSDQRAKVLEKPPESFSNLVQKIQVRHFSWIDKIGKGDTKKIGFFAQEVEKVLPDAVGKNTNVVPTIYREADSFTDTTITIKGHGLTTEKKIEVVDPENDKHVAEITRVIDSDTIEVKFEKKPKDKLFVIGPEVDDSRVINHDYLMAVSFGAVKEIIEENKSLRNQISSLAARLEALEQIQLK
jgi:hypothetical protein